MTHLTPLNGIPSERGNDRPTRADAREDDRRFEVLPGFERLVRNYDREHEPR